MVVGTMIDCFLEGIAVGLVLTGCSVEGWVVGFKLFGC